MVSNRTKTIGLIGIIAAMDEEVDAILNLMDKKETIIYNNLHFYRCELNDQDIIIGKSGVGKVQAAMAATILTTYFKAEVVINVGIAGSLQSDVSLEKVVIAEMIAQWDFDLTAFDETKGFDNPRYTLKVSDIILAKIKKCLVDDKSTLFGPMVTGDQFIYQSSQIKAIKEAYPQALCVDMEGGAIAQVCSFLDIPFLIIRTISDVVANDGNKETYESLIHRASDVAAKYASIIIEALHND